MKTSTYEMIERVKRLGIADSDAWAIRRIAMTLHRWYELECGDGHGVIERDEDTRKPYWVSAYTGKRRPTPDRETGAIKRLDAIMGRYPTLSYHLQTDPRGAPVYLLKSGDVPDGGSADSYYSNGVAVYK